MRSVLISAAGRAFAVLVVVLTAVGTIWAVLFKVWHPLWGDASTPVIAAHGAHFACNPRLDMCYSTSPAWTIPLAVAIALTGLLVAVTLYRPSPISR